MRVAVVHNGRGDHVLHRGAEPNRERLEPSIVRDLVASLRRRGHDATALHGDMDLPPALQSFLGPTVDDGSGIVFNVAYGIQGRDRYTHVPALLEMLGVPYVGSGPRAHSVALDKWVTKAVLDEEGLPTLRAWLLSPGDPLPDTPLPAVVKPRREARSLGLRLAEDRAALRHAVERVWRMYRQAAVVQPYIPGDEMYVALAGRPLEPLPPVRLLFGKGRRFFTRADKDDPALRDIRLEAPAAIDGGIAARATEMARRAARAVGCRDLARVDLRVDADAEVWILEVNSIPGLGRDGPYVRAAAAAGLSFPDLADRLVREASGRRREVLA